MRLVSTEIIEELRPYVTDFYFYRTSGACGSFCASLYDAIFRADVNNLARLAKGFPVEVDLFKEWQKAASEEEFFAQYGITREGEWLMVEHDLVEKENV